MFGRQAHKCRAKYGILTSRKNRYDLIAVFNGKIDLGPDTFSDPVFLHCNHFFRPSRQFVTVKQKILGKVGNLEKPLPQLLLTNLPATAPAQAGFNLFIGQNRLAVFAPVHKRLFAVSRALFIHFQKQPLFPAIVRRLAGCKLPAPIVAESHAPELGPHGIDIGIGPFGRMGFIGNGGIFGRHAESIPSHGMQDVKSAHTFIAGHHIPDGIIADMSNMNISRGIGKHFKQIIFRLGGVLLYPE